MANGDGNVEYTFEGNPECDICGALAGTTDSRPIPPPHENCQCTSEATCENEYSFGGGPAGSGGVTRYGPHGSCFTLTEEVTVTCWDGTEIGESVELDYGCEGADQAEDFWEDVWDQTGGAAAEMADGCPPCAPPLVS
jgi:hypothetical protein